MRGLSFSQDSTRQVLALGAQWVHITLMSKTEAKKTEKTMFALTAQITAARSVRDFGTAERLETELARLYRARWA